MRRLNKLQAGVTVVFWAATLMFTWSLANNYLFEKELTFTTPCIMPNQTSEFMDVNELYGSNGMPWGVPEQPREVDRLKQSCLAWQKGYNFLNGTVLPYSMLVILLMILRFRGDNWKRMFNSDYMGDLKSGWKLEHND